MIPVVLECRILSCFVGNDRKISIHVIAVLNSFAGRSGYSRNVVIRVTLKRNGFAVGMSYAVLGEGDYIAVSICNLLNTVCSAEYLYCSVSSCELVLARSIWSDSAAVAQGSTVVNQIGGSSYSF